MRTIRVTTAAVAAFFVLAPSGGAAQDPQRPTVPVIVTAGQGEVKVAPDRATVTIGVQSRAATAAAATAENSRKQKAVIDAIRKRGVPAEQIATMGFNVNPETQYDRNGQTAPKTLSYVVSNMVTIELTQLDLVGPVIDAGITAGANQIHGLDYRIANADSARRAALSIAVVRARGDAEVAARAAGGSLGQLIELLATDHQMPQPRYRMSDVMVSAAAGAPVPVEPGMETVQASVTVRWQYVPGPPR
jgi:uncharacterized protein YggE